MIERAAGDIEDVPETGFGPRTTPFWGTLGFITLEGTGFVLAAGSLLYLYAVNRIWPIGAGPPDKTAGTIITAVLLVSLIPNHLVKRWAEQKDLRRVRIGLVIMCLFGIAPLVVRWYEFLSLNIGWSDNAYGSALWLLLGLHTVHLLTDVAETMVLTALMFTRHGNSGKRYSDCSDNAFYWDFVVIAWLPIYALIYWMPTR